MADPAFAKALEDALELGTKIVRGVALKTFGEVTRRTPVDTGRLRGNWQVTLNQLASGEVDRTDKGDTLVNAEAMQRAAQMTHKDTIIMTNNLPYADPIENGNERMRGQFMLKSSVAAVSIELKKAIAENTET